MQLETLRNQELEINLGAQVNIQSEKRNHNKIQSLKNGDQYHQFSSVQLLSHVRHFVTPQSAACQTSLSVINSPSLPKLMSIESLMPSNHLIFCHPLLFPPSIFPSIRIFSNESVLLVRWPKYWSFNLSISPSSEYSGLISQLPVI